MKHLIVSISLLLIGNLCPKAQMGSAKQPCNLGIPTNTTYSKAAELQAVLDRYTQKDLLGISIALYSDKEGWWTAASGYASIETKSPMTICHLQYLQSVSKTFMAVTILQMHEEGKIGLDDPITKYLPKKYSDVIANSKHITIRMLLNHTSGIAEYISHPRYTAAVILNPKKVFSMDAAIELLKGEKPQFEPGTSYLYTNTNYLLLATIADAITGDHAEYIRKHIFHPLGMANSYYNPRKMNMDYNGLPDSYWDILNVGRPANITEMQKANEMKDEVLKVLL